MANEAKLWVETELPVMFNCADAGAIEKGAFLILSGAMEVTTHAADANAIMAGIAAEEKIANDGKTKIAVYRRGIFQVTANAAVNTLGAALAMDAAANKVKIATVANVGSQLIGSALETCDAQDDTIMIELNIGAMNNNAYA